MFWQSIKMAFKSLGSNKLRTFLTMLGVIIGVTTVALLTTVTSGATDAVIGALYKESRLVSVSSMSNNKPLYQSTIDEIALSLQAREDLGSFDYMVTVKNNIHVNQAQKTVDITLQGQTSTMAVTSTVNSVQENFTTIRDLEIEGEFIQNTNECLVDESFIKAYFGESATITKVIGQTVTLGGTLQYVVKLTLPAQAQAQAYYNVIKQMLFTQLPEYNESFLQGNILTLTVENPQFLLTEEAVVGSVQNICQASQLTAPQSITKTESFMGGEEYTIVGVLKSSSSSISMSGSTSSTDGMAGVGDMMQFLKAKQGNVYVLWDTANIALFSSTATQLSEIPMNAAYFLFETEDVVDAGSAALMMEFQTKGYTVMEDVVILSMKSIASIADQAMDILQIMLTVISGISLVVGGIGIMNIMLVTVSERTREIGIRKAIGAKKSSILLQFLLEALVVTLLGGAIGLVLSAVSALIIGNLMGITLMMPVWVIFLSLGFCVGIGVIFGMYPAVKAAFLQPIDALRHE